MSKIITFGPPKEAALYFDEVYPLDIQAIKVTVIPKRLISERDIRLSNLSLPIESRDKSLKIISSLLPNEEFHSEIANEFIKATVPVLLHRLLADAQSQGQEGVFDILSSVPLAANSFEYLGFNSEQVIEEIQAGEFDSRKYTRAASEFIVECLDKRGFGGKPIWDAVSEGLDKISNPDDLSRDARIAMAIRDLSLVNPESISWEAIIEFRKDKKSRLSLRRFRTFFSDNFEGKDPEYVKDALCVALEDHQMTAKEWGFDVLERTFAVASSERGAIASGVGMLAGGVVGGSITAAATGGLAFVIAGLSFEIFRTHRTQRNELIKSDVRYLSLLSDLSKEQEK